MPDRENFLVSWVFLYVLSRKFHFKRYFFTDSCFHFFLALMFESLVIPLLCLTIVLHSSLSQAILAVHSQEHWGVQWILQQVQEVFYWHGWRKDTALFVTECAGCLHREEILKCGIIQGPCKKRQPHLVHWPQLSLNNFCK